MSFREVQNSFSLGELDPILISRGDFEGYYKGARRLRDVVVLPQAGAKRRWGIDYKFTIYDTNTTLPVTDSTLINGFVYDFSPAKRFLILATPFDVGGLNQVGFNLYLDDVFLTLQVSSDYSVDQIGELYFIEAIDRVIILHKDVAPHQLKRGANDFIWTITEANFDYLPTYDFSLIDGTTYRGATDTFTPSATTGVGITITAANAVFTAGHVGGIFLGDGGILRITAVNAGGTIATGDTVEDFASVAAIKGINASLSEVAWGIAKAGPPAVVARGWPSKGEINQNRFTVGAVPSLLNIESFSSSGDFYNFDDSEALDTNAFSIGIGSDEIVDIVSSKGLVVIGASSIHASSMLVESPITAGNVFINKQAEIGSAPLLAHSLDGQIFFVDENKNRVNSASFDLASNSLVVRDVSLQSAHLIRNPVSTAVYKPLDNNGALLMIVNNDGTVAQFQTLIAQEIQAWTLAKTQGTFEKIFSSRQNAWALIKRSLGTGAVTTGLIDNVYRGNSSFEGFTDITGAAQSALTDVELLPLEDDYILIGHDAPYYRTSLTFATPANSDLELVWEYLDKFGSWTTFSVTDGTSGFSADGDVVWDLTADTPNWRPLDVREYLPPGASLPPDTLAGTPLKFWIRAKRGAPGVIDAGFTADTAFTNFTFVTSRFREPALNTAFFEIDGDFLVIGHRKAFNILNVTLDTNASADTFPIFHYLDYDGNWQNFSPIADGTNGFVGSGAITWNEALFTNWTTQMVNGINDMFWIRIQRNQPVLAVAPIEQTIFLDITTDAIESTVLINSDKRLYVEKITYDQDMDSVEETTSDANGLVIGLDHLVAQQIYAVIGGVPEGPYFVSDAGTITVSEVSSSVTVGLNFIPDITPMPLISRAFFNQNVYEPKHIKSVYIDYFESLGVTVNGFEIPSLALGAFATDQIPIPMTNFWEYTPMRGWDPRAEINISQELPLPMTIIGIGYKMEIS